jgi:hypothetical protein
MMTRYAIAVAGKPKSGGVPVLVNDSVASSVYAVNTAVFSPNNTYGSTTSNQKYVLYHTAVQ